MSKSHFYIIWISWLLIPLILSLLSNIGTNLYWGTNPTYCFSTFKLLVLIYIGQLVPLIVSLLLNLMLQNTINFFFLISTIVFIYIIFYKEFHIKKSPIFELVISKYFLLSIFSLEKKKKLSLKNKEQSNPFYWTASIWNCNAIKINCLHSVFKVCDIGLRIWQIIHDVADYSN